MNNVSWNYFDKFDKVIKHYMGPTGEGETMASQIVTAINKLIYKWYNDGDVFDNTYFLDGWCNDLSSYANWLYKYTTPNVKIILDTIEETHNDNEYEHLLQELADECLNEEFLSKFASPKQGTIYNCDGKFEFKDSSDDYYEEDEYDDYYDDEEEDE